MAFDRQDKRRPPEQYRRPLRDRPVFWVIVGIVGILLAIFIGMSIFTIGAGEVGVKFDPFARYQVLNIERNQYETSSVSPIEFGEGIHLKPFWASISRYNVKTQDYTMSIIAEEGNLERDDRIRTVTSEGLYVGLDITVLYSLEGPRADEIRRSLGQENEYQQILVRPTIRSAIREVVSSHEAADIYGEKRVAVQQEIFNKIGSDLTSWGVKVEQILLRDVELPPTVATAIEAKKQAEQEALQMQYVLEKARLEADRKVIEAQGIVDASNTITASGMSEGYLTWLWINNIKDLPNAVYIVVPSEGGAPNFVLPSK